MIYAQNNLVQLHLVSTELGRQVVAVVNRLFLRKYLIGLVSVHGNYTRKQNNTERKQN